MKTQLTTLQKLTRARTQLLLKQPFFGTLSLRLKLVAGSLPTMATDGSRIVFNSDFVDELTPAQLEGVIAHEVLHCALGHHCRRGQRDPRLWNKAADLAINPILIRNGLILPEGALFDSACDNLSAEDIYARLQKQSAGPNKEQQDQEGSGSQSERKPGSSTTPQAGAGPDNSASQGCLESTSARTGDVPVGAFGEVLDAADNQNKPASPAEQNRQQHEWAVAAEQAIRTAKACGHEPANMDRPLSETKESRQDWRSILRDFIAATLTKQ